MPYKQTRNPNLNTKGTVGWCLKYARDVFSIGSKYPTAWDAWAHSKQHKNKSYPNVATPLWFSYVVGGKNMGHVVIRVPGKGYYSSPYKYGTTHAVLKSVSEVELKYHCKYAGWSTDINGVAVMKAVASLPVATVKKGTWNVRTGAGVKYSVIGHVSGGQKYQIYGVVNGWKKIKFNGRYGYVSPLGWV